MQNLKEEAEDQYQDVRSRVKDISMEPDGDLEYLFHITTLEGEHLQVRMSEPEAFVVTRADGQQSTFDSLNEMLMNTSPLYARSFLGDCAGKLQALAALQENE
eukprot:NODE_4768_length_554_cov_156.615842_g3481_i0.p2 GENE.NODE_4768_length_554_cov_156.615842_g3481_i0~~NODE_4768_length_554_cov_156.615842_g3481_i0.p2  ORF type:complete len:103 (-),score=10.31 NODE_4768_length_554_cov_156.615842_g3481_i0:145-453(-)